MRPTDDSQRPAEVRTRRSLALLLVAAGALAGWMGADWWRAHAVAAAIGALSPAEQQATFARARDELMTTCSEQPVRLAEHCRAQAEFILAFPECDDACTQLAHRFLSNARR